MSTYKSEARDDPHAATTARPRVRDRIFETACELFYRHGIRAVGVDAIACEAGTNKMSFYRSFASKDELVAEYLRDRQREFWTWWNDAIAPHAGNPRRQIEALFESHLAHVEESDCRGCALGNAAVEISDDNDALSTLVRDYKQRIRHELHKMARAMGARDADALGDSLMLLMDGSYFTRLVFPGDSGPVRSLMGAVRALIDGHTR
ncbi:MAG TPA: TetR/AcrR family transcriptional regulator [Steroidobacteraceae bacterium]|jgi:AcrR family transcriptional regulator|nr:TetR/AcrR family transcriptional regulator [Steroidobacteraceae bacterium]